MILVARQNVFDAALRGLGYEKSNIDDMVKMAWEALDPCSCSNQSIHTVIFSD